MVTMKIYFSHVFKKIICNTRNKFDLGLVMRKPLRLGLIQLFKSFGPWA